MCAFTVENVLKDHNACIMNGCKLLYTTSQFECPSKWNVLRLINEIGEKAVHVFCGLVSNCPVIVSKK